jgi:hypothetical protein
MEPIKTLAEAEADLAVAQLSGDPQAVARAKSAYLLSYAQHQREQLIEQSRKANAHQQNLQRLREQGRAAERTVVAVRHGRPEPQTRYERRQLDILARRERRPEAARGKVRNQAEQTGV